MPFLSIPGRSDRPLYFVQNAETHPPGTLPALLLHRAGGSSKAWMPHLGKVNGRCQLIAVDMPGHGESPGPALESIEEMAELVSVALDQLGISQVVLAGHSMGGAIALTLAIKRPDLAAAVLLLSSGAKLRVAKPVLESIRTQFDMLPGLMEQLIFSKDTPREVIEAHLPHLFDAPSEVVLADLEACDRFDAESEVYEITVPIMLLTGKEDHLTPPRLARRIAERVAHATVRVIAGSGHMLPLEQPELVASALIGLTTTSGEAHHG